MVETGCLGEDDRSRVLLESLQRDAARVRLNSSKSKNRVLETYRSVQTRKRNDRRLHRAFALVDEAASEFAIVIGETEHIALVAACADARDLERSTRALADMSADVHVPGRAARPPRHPLIEESRWREESG